MCSQRKGDERIKQRLQSAATVFLCCFMLAGCAVFTKDTAELLKPPALPGEISKIADAIRQNAGEDYTLIYPARGEYRSAVVQEDIDGDGKEEALAFYSKTEKEETTAYLDLFCADEDEWQLAARQKIVAGGVDQAELYDLDGDGKKEIVIGWEIYGTSEMQLAVYNFSGRELKQEMLEQYTSFACCDLNGNQTGDIVLIRLNTAEQSNTALWYEWNGSKKAMEVRSSCPLDATVKSVNDPIVAAVSSGETAVYLDEIKGVGAVTEVLLARKDLLVNPLLNPESGETSATLRSAAFLVKDINADGFMEIPVQRNVPSVTESETNEKLYLTDWCAFDGKTLTKQLTAMMNTVDEYYYVLPDEMAGKIAVLKDTDKHLRGIYRYEPETGGVSDLLVSFVAIPSESDWAVYRKEGYRQLLSDEVWTYLCKTGDKAKGAPAFEEVKAAFRMIDKG